MTDPLVTQAMDRLQARAHELVVEDESDRHTSNATPRAGPRVHGFSGHQRVSRRHPNELVQ
jgi:hypothetical protein